MKLHQRIETCFQRFSEQIPHVRVVLLHPKSRYRSVLLARLVNAPELPTFYYALGPDDISVQSFVMGITHDLSAQFPTFGRHTYLIPDTAFDEFESNTDLIIDTFVKDLSEISREIFLLILDEYDLCDSADDVQVFVERLIDRMPENCRIVINSRTLPRLPWISFVAQNQAIILQDADIIGENFYDLVNDDNGALEIYALGPGFVLLDNAFIDAWEGHLPRLLLFFALDRPVVTRSDICRAFWPELNADQAVNVFHVTKRRLHKALDLDILIHEEGYYSVNPGISIYYDVAEFVKVLMLARNPNTTDRTAAWQRAIDLYRGPFLQGHNDRWIINRRHDYRVGYVEALDHMAKLWLARERPEQSLSLYQRAVAEDITLEPIHREIMQLFSQLGRRSEAAAHFQRLSEEFMRLNRRLSDDTLRLYETIMA